MLSTDRFGTGPMPGLGFFKAFRFRISSFWALSTAPSDHIYGNRPHRTPTAGTRTASFPELFAHQTEIYACQAQPYASVPSPRSGGTWVRIRERSSFNRFSRTWSTSLRVFLGFPNCKGLLENSVPIGARPRPVRIFQPVRASRRLVRSKMTVSAVVSTCLLLSQRVTGMNTA